MQQHNAASTVKSLHVLRLKVEMSWDCVERKRHSHDCFMCINGSTTTRCKNEKDDHVYCIAICVKVLNMGQTFYEFHLESHVNSM